MSSDWVTTRNAVLDIFKKALASGWNTLSDNAKEQISELVAIAQDIDANKDEMDAQARKQLLDNQAEAIKNVLLAEKIIAETIIIKAINDAVDVILKNAPKLFL